MIDNPKLVVHCEQCMVNLEVRDGANSTTWRAKGVFGFEAFCTGCFNRFKVILTLSEEKP